MCGVSFGQTKARGCRPVECKAAGNLRLERGHHSAVLRRVKIATFCILALLSKPASQQARFMRHWVSSIM